MQVLLMCCEAWARTWLESGVGFRSKVAGEMRHPDRDACMGSHIPSSLTPNQTILHVQQQPRWSR